MYQETPGAGKDTQVYTLSKMVWTSGSGGRASGHPRHCVCQAQDTSRGSVKLQYIRRHLHYYVFLSAAEAFPIVHDNVWTSIRLATAHLAQGTTAHLGHVKHGQQWFMLRGTASTQES